jgi:heptaprenyl diphosphate synthase
MNETLSITREDHLVAWLAALAITIHIAESALPSPLPGVKPGLANVVTLVVLARYGFRVAVWVALLRVLVGSLLLGTLFSPTFFLSLSGALASLAVLGVAAGWSARLPAWGLGPVGYGVLAAMAHMAGQFLTAYVLFIPHPGLFTLLPVLMTLSVPLGLVSGMIALAVIKRLDTPVT